MAPRSLEGDQYNRVKVKLRLLRNDGGEDDEVEAETYVWADGSVDLEDGEWDFEEFRREKMSRWIGDDEEYEGELRPSIDSVYDGIRVAIEADDVA